MKWAAIKPSHGFIAVDEEWALSRNWPPTTRYPGSDPPKGVYLLEGYHQIHCLVSHITLLVRHCICLIRVLSDHNQKSL